MPNRIALVCCGKQKLTTAAPAQELYTSTLFQKTRSYVERNYDGWVVLSALHHVLAPSDVIAPYEFKLGQQDSDKWAELVVSQLVAQLKPGSCLDYFGGATYGRVVPRLEAAGFLVGQPLAGLQVGERLRWFKQREA